MVSLEEELELEVGAQGRLRHAVLATRFVMPIREDPLLEERRQTIAFIKEIELMDTRAFVEEDDESEKVPAASEEAVQRSALVRREFNLSPKPGQTVRVERLVEDGTVEVTIQDTHASFTALIPADAIEVTESASIKDRLKNLANGSFWSWLGSQSRRSGGNTEEERMGTFLRWKLRQDEKTRWDFIKESAEEFEMKGRDLSFARWLWEFSKISDPCPF